MLSLASNISSTQVVESKYSAIFDGSDDYIDSNNTFKTTFNDSFSISVWVKIDDGQPSATKYICGSSNSSSQDEVFIKVTTDGKLSFTIKSNTDTGTRVSNSNVFVDNANDWKHIVCTATKGGSGDTALAIYVNGSEIVDGVDSTHSTYSSILTVANHGNFDTDINISIGALNNNGTRQGYFDGAIDEFAIFNTALDSDAVSSIYNSGSPLNLTFDQGNYDNSSALQAYYRMGNGLFDDKANGVVYDQDNPGFGSDLITNGDFSNGFTGISNSNATIVDGAAKIDNTGLGGANAYVIFPSSGTIGVVGDVYKLMYDVIATNGQTLTIEGTPNNNLDTDTVGRDKVKYFRFSKSSGTLVIKRLNSGVDTNVTIDNIRFFKLNGKPSLTSGGVTFSSSTP